MDINFIQNNIWILAVLAIWELAWKGLALWRAARNEERYWFVALLFINTIGILPIAYLLIKDKGFRQLKWRIGL